MAVTVETEPAVHFGRPQELFRGSYISDVNEGTPWDIHPITKRFLMMKAARPIEEQASEPTSRKINIVLNWFEELKQKVPVD